MIATYAPVKMILHCPDCGRSTVQRTMHLGGPTRMRTITTFCASVCGFTTVQEARPDGSIIHQTTDPTHNRQVYLEGTGILWSQPA